MTTAIKELLIARFIKEFETQPLLVFSPGRINLIGEHTDYNNGFVFPAAVDKGIYIAIQKSTSKSSSIIALDKEEAFSFSIQKVSKIDNGDWRNFVLGVVAEIQKKKEIPDNFNLVFCGDIPSGSGLSSSAALENGIGFAINELFSLGLSKNELILISQKAEHNFVGVQCGIMDQYASMFGKENSALLLDCQNLKSSIYPIDFKDYEILLINSNVKHNLADSAYNDRRKVCESIAAKFEKTSLRELSKSDLLDIKDSITKEDFQKALYVFEENERVLSAGKAIENNSLKELGELLFASHEGMKNQYKITCEELDYLVDLAKNNPNVLGARMMGGGFGGCTINLVHKNHIETYQKEVAVAYANRFQKDCSFYTMKLSKGTHLVH